MGCRGCVHRRGDVLPCTVSVHAPTNFLDEHVRVTLVGLCPVHCCHRAARCFDDPAIKCEGHARWYVLCRVLRIVLLPVLWWAWRRTVLFLCGWAYHSYRLLSCLLPPARYCTPVILLAALRAVSCACCCRPMLPVPVADLSSVLFAIRDISASGVHAECVTSALTCCARLCVATAEVHMLRGSRVCRRQRSACWYVPQVSRGQHPTSAIVSTVFANVCGFNAAHPVLSDALLLVCTRFAHHVALSKNSFPPQALRSMVPTNVQPQVRCAVACVFVYVCWCVRACVWCVKRQRGTICAARLTSRWFCSWWRVCRVSLLPQTPHRRFTMWATRPRNPYHPSRFAMGAMQRPLSNMLSIFCSGYGPTCAPPRLAHFVLHKYGRWHCSSQAM